MCEEHEYNGAYVYLPGGVVQMDEDGVADYWEKKELKTDLPGLKGYETQQLPIGPEGFSHEKFANALAHINPAYSVVGDGTELVDDTSTHGLMLDQYDPREATELKDVSSDGFDLASKWGEVRDEIGRVTLHFNDALDRMLSQKDHWDGRTKLSAFENVKQSFKAPSLIGQSAGTMQTLVDGFTRAVEYVYQNIEGNRPSYLMTIKGWNAENEHDKPLSDYVHAFDSLARRVLGGHYSETISAISDRNPEFTTGDLPDLGGTDPDPTGRNQGQGLGLGDGLGNGGGPVPNFGNPRMPEFTDPKLPTRPSLPTIPPTGTDDRPGLPEGPGDPTQAASNATPPSGMGGPPPAGGGASPSPMGKDPREGALGLGPKGLGGPLKKSGGAGGGGGGAGKGPLGGKPPLGSARPPSPAATPAARAGLAAGAAGAGLGSGAGVPPMMPPPAAGQRGDANGKGHQTMKALRRKKTGEEVMGRADAVVPVVGETERPEPAQPEPDEEVQSERRRVVDRPVPRIGTGDVRQLS